MPSPDLWRALWARLVSELPGRLEPVRDIAARTADERKPLGASTVSRVLTGKLPNAATTCLRVLRACGADDLQMLRAAVLLGDDLRGLMAALPRQIVPGARVRVVELAEWPAGVSVERPDAGSLGRVEVIEPDATPPRALVLLDSELEDRLDLGDSIPVLLLHWLPLAGLEVAT